MDIGIKTFWPPEGSATWSMITTDHQVWDFLTKTLTGGPTEQYWKKNNQNKTIDLEIVFQNPQQYWFIKCGILYVIVMYFLSVDCESTALVMFKQPKTNCI